jgi:O-antigen/teichoic acid export membrane protein
VKQRSLLQGFVWNAIEMLGRQGVDFVTTLVLARLLSPESFGLIGMMTVFFALAQSLMDSGFKQALIQTQQPTKIQYDSVFWLNIALGILLYGLLFLGAPYIATFYNQVELIGLIRWAGLIVPINAFQIVQTARMSRELNFKLQTQITIPAEVISGMVAIGLAYTNWGVWSLIAKMLAFSSTSSSIYWILGRYKPRLQFSWKEIKPLFQFGYKLTLAGLLNTLFNNLYYALIGKMFSAQTLGFYTQAKKLADIPSQNAAAILQKVTFPYLSRLRDDKVKLVYRFRIILQLAVLLAAPVMLFIATWSNEMVIWLYGEKWSAAGPMLQILAFIGLLYPIHAINLNMLKVLGRTDLYLKLEVYKKLLVAIAIAVAASFGVQGLLIGQLCTSLVALFINAYYTRRFLSLGIIEQFSDLLIYLMLAACCFWGLDEFNMAMSIGITWGYVAGIAFILYVVSNLLFHTPGAMLIVNSLKEKRIALNEQ